MELTLVYTIVGFGLAGWSVIGNDSVQTLGTFIGLSGILLQALPLELWQLL